MGNLRSLITLQRFSAGVWENVSYPFLRIMLAAHLAFLQRTLSILAAYTLLIRLAIISITAAVLWSFCIDLVKHIKIIENSIGIGWAALPKMLANSKDFPQKFPLYHIIFSSKYAEKCGEKYGPKLTNPINTGRIRGLGGGRKPTMPEKFSF